MGAKLTINAIHGVYVSGLVCIDRTKQNTKKMCKERNDQLIINGDDGSRVEHCMMQLHYGRE
eukprot:scaffold84989_cov59-Attheya_sp.AAC.2